MKIVVPIRQVPALDEQLQPNQARTGVDAESADWELNEWDAFSLEAAVQLKDATGTGEVIALTVDDSGADEALVTCLAKGADRAVRVWDDELRTADAIGIAHVLAEVVRTERPDLVLCGVQSSEWASAATGTALAALCGLTRVAVVKSITATGGILTVVRELEGGLTEVLRVSTPALLTIQTGINEPRYANFRARKQAREKPSAQLSLSDFGLDASAVLASSGGRVVDVAVPETGAGAEMIPGGATAVAERITAILTEAGVRL